MRCKLCGSTLIKDKFTIKKFNPNFDIFECTECGFQFRDINDSEAFQYYNEDYYKGKAEYSYIDERKNEEACRIVWKERIRKLKKWDKSIENSVKNYLDTGCSFGGLMQVAQEAGYDSYGIEISNYAGSYAEKRFGKNKIFIGNCESINLPINYFSIVTMIEVIEHLNHPETALKNIFQSMRKGGVLLVQTADMAGLQALVNKENYHYYLPGHLSYFTRLNLKQLLEKTGFSKIKFIGGVEFGIIPKLLKSRNGFKIWMDYFQWIRIIFYHYLSKVNFFGFHLTSSMVMAAWK